jgi:KUP system potassium uptake protein
VPWVAASARALVEPIAGRCFSILLRFGFKDRIDVPAALAALADSGHGIDVDPMTTSYFLSRATVVPTFGKGMAAWREKLFASMHRNATSASDFLNLPPNRVVELGTKVQI